MKLPLPASTRTASQPQTPVFAGSPAHAERVEGISFSAAKLEQYADEILARGGPRAIRVREPAWKWKAASMVFVARHEDAVAVLSDENTFSLSPYGVQFKKIAPRGGYLLMREPGTERKERLGILASAAGASFLGKTDEVRRIAGEVVADVVKRLREREDKRFDIVGEYGNLIPYLVACRLFGLPGPGQFSLLAWLITWARNAPRGRPFGPEMRPYWTQYAWSQLVFAQILTNFENRAWYLIPLARWAIRCFLRHIRTQMRLRDAYDVPLQPSSLISAFREVKKSSLIGHREFADHVAYLLLELVGTAMLVPGMGFANIVERLARQRGSFPSQLEKFEPKTAAAFIDEALRLTPPADRLIRRATCDTRLGGFDIFAGEYVCVLAARASRDASAFDEPEKLVLGRKAPLYLHFGPEGGPHRCFGRELAHAMLAAMLAGLKQLPELRPLESMKRAGTPERMMCAFSARAEVRV